MEIPEVDLDAFMAFLRYVYGDHCPLEEGEATTILVLANKYCMSRLKALCELYISEIVEQASDSSITTGELDVIGKQKIIELKQNYTLVIFQIPRKYLKIISHWKHYLQLATLLQ